MASGPQAALLNNGHILKQGEGATHPSAADGLEMRLVGSIYGS